MTEHSDALPDDDRDDDREYDRRQDEAARDAEERGRCVYDCGACWRCR